MQFSQNVYGYWPCTSSWVFTDMQSVHIRMNSSLSPPKKILDPPMRPGPVLASAEPDWKHFCGAPLSGVSRNFWRGASSHDHRNHEWCERARPKKGNAKLGCLGSCPSVSGVQRSDDALGDCLILCHLPNSSIEQWSTWRTTPYIYVARTSNNRVIMACELYCSEKNRVWKSDSGHLCCASFWSIRRNFQLMTKFEMMHILQAQVCGLTYQQNETWN